jgi:hypothetical protein
MITKRLEFIEPVPTCDEHAGTFTYTQPDGEEVTADFFVRCCPAVDGDSVIKSERMDALNSQLTNQWSELMNSGCKNIKYVEIHPNPFF